MEELYSLTDRVDVETGGPADVAPPGDDPAEVVQRAVSSGDQVLDHLFLEARSPDALVQLGHTAVRGPRLSL